MAWSGQDEVFSQWTPRNYMYDNFAFIQAELTEDTCHHFIADLAKFVLSEDNAGKNLNIVLNSPGGQADCMFQISGLISMAKLRDIKVTTWVLGAAASSASLIAVQGTERIMSRNAYHFVHFGCLFDVTTKFTEIEKTFKQNKEFHNRIRRIYLDNCPNLTEEHLTKLMEDERGTIMGDECLKLGFCDRIIEDELDQKTNIFKTEMAMVDEYEKWKKESKKKSPKSSAKKKRK